MEILTVEKDVECLLTRVADQVLEFDQELKDFALELNNVIQNVTWGNCVGMAANQVGDPRALFIAEGVVYVNPEIVSESKAPLDYANEGCYSIGKEAGDFRVGRAPSIVLWWQDFEGNPREKKFNGFHARVIQHENDHLLGLMCNRERN